MSRQDKLKPPSAQGSREPDCDEILLQLRVRLRLDEVADVEAKLLRARAHRQPSERELRELASNIYDARREQDRMLADKSFGDPAWDMLLALYHLPAKGIFLGVTSLAHAANISEASGSRWQKILLEEELIERGPSVTDGRQYLVRLTNKGRLLIESYLTRLYFFASERVPEMDKDEA